MQVSRFSFTIQAFAIAMIFMWQTGQGQQAGGEAEDRIPDVAVAAQPATLQFDVEFYHIPSDSTFFWDRGLINLKRRNPQGEGHLSEEKLKVFKESIISQGGKMLMSPAVQTLEHRGASMVMGINGEAFFFLLRDCRLNEGSVAMDLVTGKTFQPDAPIPNDLGMGLSGEWKGEVPLGNSLYLVLRSRDPGIADNYVVMIKPGKAD